MVDCAVCFFVKHFAVRFISFSDYLIIQSNLKSISAINRKVPSQVFPSAARLSPSEHKQFAPSGVSKQSWLHPPLLLLHSSVIEKNKVYCVII